MGVEEMKTPEQVADEVADKLQMIGRPRWPQEIAFVRAGMIEGLLEATNLVGALQEQRERAEKAECERDAAIRELDEAKATNEKQRATDRDRLRVPVCWRRSKWRGLKAKVTP